MNIANFLLSNINFLGFLGWITGNDSAETASGVLLDVIRTFCMWLCSFIYPLIGFFYNLFTKIAESKILEQDSIKPFYNRITILLGVIMLFVTIFSLIKFLLNPDKINDREQGLGSVIKRILVVIVLLGFTPKIFEIAFDLQDNLLKNQVIPQVILGKDVSAEGALQDHGKNLAIQILTQFYKPNKDASEDACPNYTFLFDEMEATGTFAGAMDCITLTETKQVSYYGTEEERNIYVMDYDSLESVIVGAIILWIVIVYVINVGVRVIQLTFLQIIAPVPIISYIVPKKDGMFEKWLKQVITTYIDVFIRVAIIYFVVYLTQIIWANDGASAFNNAFAGSDASTVVWAKIIITIALLMFAKRFPKLIQEMTGKPSAASLGFGLTNDGVKMVAGAVTVGATNFVGSTGAARFTGLAKGLLAGGAAGLADGKYSQNMDRALAKAKKSNDADEWLKMQGYKGFDRYRQRMIMAAGGITQGEREAYAAQAYDNAKAVVDDEDEMKDISAWESHAQAYGMNDLIARLVAEGRVTGAVGSRVVTDRNGHVIFDERTTRTSLDSINSLKEMKANAGTRIMNDKTNSAVQSQMKVLRRVDRNKAPATYKELKDRRGFHKSKAARRPMPRGTSFLPK